MTILDTLDELTKERKDHLVPKNDDGTLGKAHKVTVKPLLVQIREATYPSGEQNGGSVGLKSTRSVIDFSALEIYADITAWIRAWCVLVELETHNDPVVDLRRWYMYWSSLNPDDNETENRHRKMREWVRRINDHIDPPTKRMIPGTCPVCGNSSYGDSVNGGDTRVIMVTVRGQAVRATCMHPDCGTIWDGYDAVDELEKEMTEKAATRATT